MHVSFAPAPSLLLPHHPTPPNSSPARSASCHDMTKAAAASHSPPSTFPLHLSDTFLCVLLVWGGGAQAGAHQDPTHTVVVHGV